MPVSEWGPKNVQKPRLQEVTRFTGLQLRQAKTEFSEHMRKNPSATRDETVTSLSTNEKQAQRMHLALDVLNQLSVIDRSGDDVSNVILRRDIANNVSEGVAQGQNHLFYEVDWSREPGDKPDMVQKSENSDQRRESTEHRSRPRRKTWRERRAEAAEIVKRSEQESAEKKRIDAVVIDRPREIGESAINIGQVKIEIDEKGEARILYRQYNAGKYFEVDRETGDYYPYRKEDSDPESFEYRFHEGLTQEYVKYFDVLAQQAEGKDAIYAPEKKPDEFYQEIYEKALELGVITFSFSPTGEARFFYPRTVEGSWVEIYGRAVMNLDQNTIDASVNSFMASSSAKKIRPINPHFSEFLKKKKAELEAASK